MDYLVAIATYGRHETIGPATLSALDKAQVNPDQIKIFVPNKEQLSDYRAELGNRYELIVSCPGQFKARQFYHRWISEEYGKGFKTIQMDDDIYGFWELVKRPDTPAGWDNVLYEGTLDSIAKQGYGLSEALGTGLWGIGFAQNYFYMSDKASAGNMLISGGFQGTYAGDDIFIGRQRTYAESAAEDNETSCLAFLKYGKVAKLQYFSIVIKDIEPGGIRQEIADKGYADSELEAARAREMTDCAAREMLVERYPQLLSVVWKDRSDAILEGGKQQMLKYRRLNSASIPRGVVEAQFLKQG